MLSQRSLVACPLLPTASTAVTRTRALSVTASGTVPRERGRRGFFDGTDGVPGRPRIDRVVRSEGREPRGGIGRAPGDDRLLSPVEAHATYWLGDLDFGRRDIDPEGPEMLGIDGQVARHVLGQHVDPVVRAGGAAVRSCCMASGMVCASESGMVAGEWSQTTRYSTLHSSSASSQ